MKKMIRKWFGIMGLLLLSSFFTVVAQTEPTTTYTSKDVAWQISAANDYSGDMRKPVIFLNVSVDEDSHIYVANFSSVLIFDAETGTLEDSIMDDTGTVVQYDDVATAGDGNVWVADSKSLAVYLLDAKGSILQSIASNPTDNQDAVMRPNELEVGPDSNLYVMYSGANTMIQVFTPEGDYLRSFTMSGRSLSSGLIDFVFGSDGNLYVAGAGTVRILDTEGNVVTETFGQDFLSASSIAVRGIAVDAVGNVYVGGSSYAKDDSLIGAVYQFDAEGQLLAQFGTGQQQADWDSEFKTDELGFTVSLAVLPEGQILISDANGAYSQLLKVDMSD